MHAPLRFFLLKVGHRVLLQAQVPAMVDDIETALLWLNGGGASTYGGDPSDISLIGQSAGAHLSAILLLRQAIRLAHESPAARNTPPLEPSGMVATSGVADPTQLWDYPPTHDVACIGDDRGRHSTQCSPLETSSLNEGYATSQLDGGSQFVSRAQPQDLIVEGPSPLSEGEPSPVSAARGLRRSPLYRLGGRLLSWVQLTAASSLVSLVMSWRRCGWRTFTYAHLTSAGVQGSAISQQPLHEPLLLVPQSSQWQPRQLVTPPRLEHGRTFIHDGIERRGRWWSAPPL